MPAGTFVAHWTRCARHGVAEAGKHGINFRSQA